MDTWQEIDNKLERAIFLTQQLEKNDLYNIFSTEIFKELKEILIFLRGLNND